MMLLLLLRNDDGVGSVCISDGTLAGRGEDVQMRLSTATESVVPPNVTILAAGAASALKPTRYSTVFGLVLMCAATATAVHRTHPGSTRRCSQSRRSHQLRSYGFPVTVAAAVTAVAPAGSKEKHGSYVDADEEYHRCETIAAAAAAAAAGVCHRRETSVAAAAAAAACHRREASVAVAAAAVVACHRREVPYRHPFVGLHLPRSPRPQNHGRRQEHAGSGGRRRTRRPLFRNSMGLALGVGGTDGVF